MLQFLWLALCECASLTLGRLPVRCPGDSKERHCVEVGSVFSKEVPAGIVLGVSASWVNAVLCEEQVSWQETLRAELRVSFGKTQVVFHLGIFFFL